MKLLLFRALCEIKLATYWIEFSINLKERIRKIGVEDWNVKNLRPFPFFFFFYFTFKIDIWKEKSNQGSGRGTRVVIGHLHGWSVATDSSPFVCVDEKFIPSLWIQIELLRFKGGTGVADGIRRTNLTVTLIFKHTYSQLFSFQLFEKSCFFEFLRERTQENWKNVSTIYLEREIYTKEEILGDKSH